jgi:hypothetical protein
MTSDNMAFAKFVDPSSPNKGISLVLLLPGIGHLAIRAMAPSALEEELGLDIRPSLYLVLVVNTVDDGWDE